MQLKTAGFPGQFTLSPRRTWPRISPPGNLAVCMLAYAALSRTASKAGARSPEWMPWVTGPVTFAAVIVPVMVPDVADGQAGWSPPPHRNIMTPPATFVGAKCKWAERRVVDSPENVIEKVIVLPTSIRNVAEPAVLFGGTSLSPISLAEKAPLRQAL